METGPHAVFKKEAAQFFGAELLPVLGIEGEIIRTTPTEQVYLELKDFYEDFNYLMADGTWCHIEFESDAITEDDLKRFRAYEAVCCYHHKVAVVTCVVCSSSVRQLRSELQLGINTYRVRIIRLKDRDADRLIEEKKRKKTLAKLSRRDLVELLLTPLMDGSMTQRDRIRESLMIIRGEREVLGKEDLLHMESMLYAFAMKFLSRNDLSEIKEVLSMTILEELLEEQNEKGLEKGLERVNQLNIRLAKENRQDDILRASMDRQYQQKLFEEFGLLP